MTLSLVILWSIECRLHILIQPYHKKVCYLCQNRCSESKTIHTFMWTVLCKNVSEDFCLISGGKGRGNIFGSLHACVYSSVRVHRDYIAHHQSRLQKRIVSDFFVGGLSFFLSASSTNHPGPLISYHIAIPKCLYLCDAAQTFFYKTSRTTKSKNTERDRVLAGDLSALNILCLGMIKICYI